ncbi:MAG: hypothetical protein AMXMBFR84_17220 [Candidatus Hydrogenedentota bacterium]
MVVVAAAFRLVDLNGKPMHGDEANQAYKAGVLYDTGVYEYDPHEHHGPTLYFGTLPFLKYAGNSSVDADAQTYRVLPALFGIGLVAILVLLKDAIGPWPAVWSAALTAMSPALTYYSRYYIQEVLLVFFTLMALASAWRYCHRPNWGWAVLTGVAVGLMHATKETCLLSFAAMAGGAAMTWVWGRAVRSRGQSEQTRQGDERRPPLALSHVTAAGLAAVLVSVLLFTSFFTHARGPLDSVLTYATYLNRAGGEGSAALHDKPWYYYLQLLAFTKRAPGPWWSEGLILTLAVTGSVATLCKRGDYPALKFQRLLVFYTILLTAAYCLIAYKTPWSMLSFYHGMILLAGIGAATLAGLFKHRMAQAIVVLFIGSGVVQLGAQNYRASFEYAADVRNPYVYAHTSTAFMRLPQRMLDLAAVHSNGTRMRILVIAANNDYWPLPWYLRAFENTGYFGEMPQALDADVIIASPPFNVDIGRMAGDEYQSEVHGLRPKVLLQVFIRRPLWNAFMETRK